MMQRSTYIVVIHTVISLSNGTVAPSDREMGAIHLPRLDGRILALARDRINVPETQILQSGLDVVSVLADQPLGNGRRLGTFVQGDGYFAVRRDHGVGDRILGRNRALGLLVAVHLLDFDLEVVGGELVACLLLG